jgi:hypothetical protein
LLFLGPLVLHPSFGISIHATITVLKRALNGGRGRV